MTDAVHDLVTPLQRQVDLAAAELRSRLAVLQSYEVRHLTARAHLARHAALAARFPTDPQAQRHLQTAQRRWRKVLCEPLPNVTAARVAFEQAVSLLTSTVDGVNAGWRTAGVV